MLTVARLLGFGDCGSATSARVGFFAFAMLACLVICFNALGQPLWRGLRPWCSPRRPTGIAKRRVIERLVTTSSTVYNVGMTTRAMQEATFLILTALAVVSQHGYGIIADVQQLSGGRVRLRAGTLYTALDRLRADGLIVVDRDEVVDNRLRRYYRLTPEGSQRLAAEAARLHANAAAAMARLKLTPGPGGIA
jgi:DNA-binding PadR family transcriptional regulator